MTKGVGIGEEMLGKSTGELMKPGMTREDLERIEKTGPADGPDPFGDIWREEKDKKAARGGAPPARAPLPDQGAVFGGGGRAPLPPQDAVTGAALYGSPPPAASAAVVPPPAAAVAVVPPPIESAAPPLAAEPKAAPPAAPAAATPGTAEVD